MEKLIMNVDGMSCQHCVQTIENGLNALPGITTTNVNLDTKEVAVEYDQVAISPTQIKTELEDLGYDVK